MVPRSDRLLRLKSQEVTDYIVWNGGNGAVYLIFLK